ncbi:MAG: alpha-L-fucosidase [Planctomycetota bacterium]
MAPSIRILRGCLALLLAATPSCGSTPTAPPTPVAAAVSDPRLDWWRDARFGLFVHWGLYAIPAGAWNERTEHGEWIRDSVRIPLEQYDDFRERFDPREFDADAWVRLAKDAGMQYVVITTKNHDGFCLFDASNTDFDVLSTPFGRDVMKEMAEACARHGLRVGWYHSIMDWHHPDYLPRRAWESRSEEGARFDRYVEYLHAQVEQLLTRYGPIGVMWFDGEWESTWTNELGRALYDHCRRLQPAVIVNNRVGTGRAGMAGLTKAGDFPGDFGTPEQEIPARGLPGVDWETCMTMNDHWGFNALDENWKSRAELVRALVDIASKGGNFLLNVGPTGAGEIPSASVERLRALGNWLAANGAAIYGTRASPLAAPSWGRCTQKPVGNDTELFLHVFDWPRDGQLVLAGLGNDVLEAALLVQPSQPCRVSRSDDALVIELPREAPDPDVSVVRVRIAGTPIVFEPPTIQAASSTFVRSLAVDVTRPSGEFDVRVTVDGSAPTLRSPRPNGALDLRDTTTVRARSFFRGRAVSAPVERTFERVVPHPPLARERVEPGVLRGRFHGTFERLPDPAALAASPAEIVPSLALPDGPREEHVAMCFRGLLEVPASDVYVLALTSDDGARLSIDGTTVVDHDGLHVALEKSGEIALARGWHALRVDWFNRTGGAELSIRWGRAGDPLAPLTSTSLGH